MIEVNKYNKEMFNNLGWVLKAINNDSDCSTMSSSVCITENFICCTDTRRLNMIKNIYGLSSGIYRVIKNTKSDIILDELVLLKIEDYYKIDAIRPTDHAEICELCNENSIVSWSKLVSKFFRNFASFTPVEIGINIDYLKDAIPVNIEMVCYKSIGSTYYNSPFMFESRDQLYTSYVMPFQIK